MPKRYRYFIAWYLIGCAFFLAVPLLDDLNRKIYAWSFLFFLGAPQKMLAFSVVYSDIRFALTFLGFSFLTFLILFLRYKIKNAVVKGMLFVSFLTVWFFGSLFGLSA